MLFHANLQNARALQGELIQNVYRDLMSSCLHFAVPFDPVFIDIFLSFVLINVIYIIYCTYSKMFYKALLFFDLAAKVSLKLGVPH